MDGLGRVGSIGGESFSGLPLLLGGLLNGETLSLSRRVLISKAWLASGRYEAREGIKGFSALLTGGGVGFASLKSLSRRSSVDRRGGGGEGGCEGGSRGDLRGSSTGVRGSNIGVCGRLDILKFLGPVAGDCGLTNESVLRKPTRSAPTASPILLGGDCGGSMRSDGGGAGRGLRGARPCREGDSGPPLLAPSDCSPARCSLSLGLILGTKGGLWVVGGGGWGAGSRRPSGFGAGDTARGAEPEAGGGGPVRVSPGLVMFSNFARSDDTGFWSC